MTKIYKSFTAIALMLMFISTGFSQKTIMFVGRSTSMDALTYQSEQDLFDSLTAWGYAPEYWSGAEIQAGGLEAFYPDYDGILVSETISSSQVNNLAADGYPLPIVNMEGYVPRDGRWNWLTDNEAGFIHTPEDPGGTEEDQFIIIKDNNHWITRNYNIDDEIRWTTGEIDNPAIIRSVSFIEEIVTFSSKLAISKAHADMSDFWTMVAIDDDVLPNRVFLWGMHATGLDAETMGVSEGTAEFFQIVRNACEWAFDGKDVGVKEVPKDVYELAAFPNPASERVIVRFNSPVHGQALATLYNITGQRIDILSKDAVAGKNFIEMSAKDYAPGIYHLGLELNGHTEYLKLVIQ